MRTGPHTDRDLPHRVLRTLAAALWTLSLLAFGACGADHSHDDEDPSHADDGGHGHSHGDEEDGSWAVTAWGEAFEIFAEAGPLVVGEVSSSHTHVTILDGFPPLEEGTVAAVLRSPDGEEAVFSQDAPVRSGIYDVAIAPEHAGEYELLFRVTTPAASEDVPAGRVRVGTTDDPGGLTEHRETAAGGSGEPVSFLKEQQWRVPFATDWVRRAEVPDAVHGLGTVRPVAGGEFVLTAPVDAVVLPAGGKAWPYPGLAVHRGRALFRLAPRLDAQPSLTTLAAEVRVLESELELARGRRQRLDQLLEVEAVSRRETEEARARETALATRLDAARADLGTVRAARRGGESGETIAIAAPTHGAVAAVDVSPGQAVDAGAVLGRVVRTDLLWLEVRLRPADAARLTADPAGLELDVAGLPAEITFSPSDLRLVSRSPEIDPATGTVGVLIELARGFEDLRIGSAVEANLQLPEMLAGVVLPATARIDDGGVDVVYVQLDGENFERREIEVRARDGGTLLVEGLAPGERLVTRGGGAIRRSSLVSTGGADHGHVH